MEAPDDPAPAHQRTAGAPYRLMVAIVTALSGSAYLRWSQELRFELADPGYKDALLAQFAHARGLAGVRLLHAVSPQGALMLAAFVGACVATGLAVRRLLGSDTGWAEVVAFGSAAAVVPAMLLATILWPDGRSLLRSVPLLAGTTMLGALAAAGAWRRSRRCARLDGVVREGGAERPDVPVPRRDPGRVWGICLVALLVPLLVVAWWNGVDAIRGFDSLADHLPRAARWLRLGRLADESGTLLTPYYPGNFQLLVRWALVLRTDAYAFVPSLAAAVLCLCAVFGICRELGQGRGTALVSTAAAASCSLVPYLATTVEADTATTAFLLLAVLLLLRWLRDGERGGEGQGDATERLAPLAAMGASLGLAVGMKYSALPPALAVLAVAAWCALRRSTGRFASGRRYLNARTLVVLLAAIVGPLALCAGYWYLRNLVQHGNPFFPVATAGLPGVDMRYIIPVKPTLAGSVLARATYPWVQWDFATVYDDGLGIAFAAVALPAFVITGLARARRGNAARLLWWITLAAYVLWLGTGSITARFGLFPLLLTFVFVGELWREFESVALKLVTTSAVLAGVAITTRSLLVGAVYTTVMPPAHRGVPEIVDRLPASRIFNATTAANRYILLGRDHRHEVITMFGPARPADMLASGARYVLLTSAQVPAFSRGATLVERGPPLATGDTLSLWDRGSAVVPSGR